MTQHTLTDEHRKQLKPWADKWVLNALRTDPMNEFDKSEMRECVNGLYKVAGFQPPKELIFVASPFAMRFLAGYKGGLAELAKEASNKASIAKLKEKLDAFEFSMMQEACNNSTESDRRAGQAIGSIGASAIELTDPREEFKESDNLWWSYPESLKGYLTDHKHKDKMIQAVRESYKLVNGGNQWSGWVCYLSFFRHVVKADLDFSNWDYYERGAIHGGPRAMHPDFCIVSDFPTKLTTDDQQRPHNDDGAYCEWADGSKLYAHHGYRTPRWVFEERHLLTIKRITETHDAELRRALIEKYGWGNYLKESGAKLVDADFGPSAFDGKACMRALMADSFGDKVLVGTDGSTKRVYSMPVPREVLTCKRAHEAIMGTTEDRLVAEC